MRKIIFMMVAVAMAFVSCQTANKSNAPATAEAVKPAPAPTNAIPPATQNNLPEWQTKAQSMAPTSVNWAEEVYNFGKVQQGTKVTHQFRFKNTGSNELLLTRVKPSCGCTTPTYSKDPVAAGTEGYIDVAFDTKGKKGRQVKTVTVTANMEGAVQKVLRIEGEVVAADQ
ncbi:MAG: DUF1573 domain-containing protein [Bacteroidota bacterium]